MNNHNPQPSFNLIRAVRKFFLSAFVVITFIVYALHKPTDSSSGQLGLAAQPNGTQLPPTLTPEAPTTAPTNTAIPTDTSVPTDAAAPTGTAAPQQVFAPTSTAVPPPTAVPPTAVPIPNTPGQYKDGTYTGPEVDAVYGLVQVQTVIQNGKIANVQVLEYPNDRRTSVRINNYAVPTLSQEAVQIQSANVDLITGATLTSQAFQESLQAALSKAKSTL